MKKLLKKERANVFTVAEIKAMIIKSAKKITKSPLSFTKESFSVLVFIFLIIFENTKPKLKPINQEVGS